MPVSVALASWLDVAANHTYVKVTAAHGLARRHRGCHSSMSYDKPRNQVPLAAYTLVFARIANLFDVQYEQIKHCVA